MELIYGKERPLFAATLVISLLLWLLLIVGTFGIALLYIAIGFVAWLFVQSAFIGWLRGTSVKVTPEQFPDLYRRFEHCCRTLQVAPKPELYLVSSHGLLNALATRFLGDNFIVLYSEVVDALEERPDAVNFYIGHELGHIRRGHLTWGPLLWPGMLLPHLGTAYSRAREYSCDLHGFACCTDPQDARHALAVLAAGARRWRGLNLAAYLGQATATGGFWMSFHEYTSDYPWLVKRMAHVDAAGRREQPKFPMRNFFAFLLACLVPRVGAGSGGAIGALFMIAMLGILAAVAIPAYQDYLGRAASTAAYQQAVPAMDALRMHYEEYGELPSSLEATDYLEDGSSAASLYLDEEGSLVVEVGDDAGAAAGKNFLLIPYLDENDEFAFACEAGTLPAKLLPAACVN